MIRKFVLTIVASMIAASAFAVNTDAIKKSYELKDGSKVHVFMNGRMGMEDRFGRAVSMQEGHAMETKDGQKIMMKGNEVWRTEDMLKHDTRP